MVGQQQRDMLVEERLGGVAQSRRSRGRIGNARHLAHQYCDLRQYVAREPLTCDRKTGSGRRMSVNDCTTILPPAVNPQVQI
jgi:hypothetical protein